MSSLCTPWGLAALATALLSSEPLEIVTARGAGPPSLCFETLKSPPRLLPKLDSDARSARGSFLFAAGTCETANPHWVIA